jgi:hypothetical protein
LVGEKIFDGLIPCIAEAKKIACFGTGTIKVKIVRILPKINYFGNHYKKRPLAASPSVKL